MKFLEDKVFTTIEQMKQDLVACVSQVIRIPSINPKYPGVVAQDVLGGEGQVSRVFGAWYKEIGCEVDLWEEEPQRTNSVAVWKGSGGGRSLIFNGHVDTVPVGRPEDWKWHDPFSGRVEEGRIYGRGACDMKGPLVCQMMAARALREAGVRLRGNLLLETVVGEEVMDHEAGVSATVKRGYRADAAIVSEPSAPTSPLGIVPVSPGLLWMSVTCMGKASHAATRGETIRAGGGGARVAVNAIDKGVFIVQALQKLEQEWGLTKHHSLFKAGHFTLHPGVIIGGPRGVLIPFFISDFCTVEYAIWYHPEQEVEAVQREVEDYIAHASRLDEWLRDHPPQVQWKLHWPPFVTPADHPICRTMAACHERAAVGSRFAGPAVMQGFYAVCDAAFLNAAGIPAVVYGPGSLLVAHAVDEYVEIDELLVATKAYAAAAIEWCGVA